MQKPLPWVDTVVMNIDPDILKSRFIVIDGADGVGKTTQVNMLQRHVETLGVKTIRTCDPGHTSVGESIRDILLHQQEMSINPVCETLLFMASRAQLVREVIRPALKEGKFVICDRFVSSTIAYQGALLEDVNNIVNVARYATGDLWPDLTIILDLEPAKTAGRIGQHPDRVEARCTEYHEKVRNLFLNLSEVYPSRTHCLCGEGTAEEVHSRVLTVLEQYFDNTES